MSPLSQPLMGVGVWGGSELLGVLFEVDNYHPIVPHYLQADMLAHKQGKAQTPCYLTKVEFGTTFL